MMRHDLWHGARSPPKYPFVNVMPKTKTKGYLFMKDEMNYIEKDGVLYPDIEMPEQKEIGKWGLLHLGWLKRFRVARYNELLMSGDLNSYLYKVNEEAQERFESLIVDLAESHGLTEELKAKDQMKWVQLANYVANAAKEIVESEVIFR